MENCLKKITLIYFFLFGMLMLVSISLSQTILHEDITEKYLDERYNVTRLENDILKLQHKRNGRIKFLKITNQNTVLNSVNEDTMQVFDLLNIDTSQFSDMYSLQGYFPVSGALGVPLVIKDFDNNGKLDFGGSYHSENYFYLALSSVAEMENASNIYLKKVYPDTAQISFAATDLDNDGFFELNCMKPKKVLNYESSSTDSLPNVLNFEFFQGSNGGNCCTETYEDLDNDNIMDLIYVANAPDYPAIHIAEYDSLINNLVVRKVLSTPEWRIKGFATGDFDDDGYKEFVAGSIEGDVFVYENTGNDDYQLVFRDTISAPNAYLTCATEDIDGNGKPEFFVGGVAYYQGIGGTRVYWFEADGNNKYKKVRSFFLLGMGFFGITELYNYDVNNDQIAELVFAFENSVVILEWDQSESFNLLYYKRYDNLYPHEIASVNIYDIFKDKKPGLLISIREHTETITTKTYYFQNNFLTRINTDYELLLDAFELMQNYPNPFNNTTIIKFHIFTSSEVILTIFDITGKEVIKLQNGKSFKPGNYSIAWNGTNKFGKEVSSGIYFYELKSNGFKKSKKMLFLK